MTQKILWKSCRLRIATSWPSPSCSWWVSLKKMVSFWWISVLLFNLCVSSWCFQIFFWSSPLLTYLKDPIWLIANGLVQPPTYVTFLLCHFRVVVEVGSFKRIWSLEHRSSKPLIWKAWNWSSTIVVKVVVLSSLQKGGLRFQKILTNFDVESFGKIMEIPMIS